MQRVRGEMKKRALLGAALILALTGCAGGPWGRDAGSESEAGGKPQEQAKDPVELYFYNTSADWDKDDYFMKEYGQHIQKKFPHVTPVFVPTSAGSLEKLAAANQRIDVIVSSVGRTFTILNSAYQTDLTPLIDKNKFDLGRFEGSSIDMIKQMGNGAIYGLPMYTLPAPLYYNADLFDKFGVPYPTDKMTWDELYETAKKLARRDGDRQYYGLTMSPNHYMLRNQLSLNLVDPSTKKATINTSQVKTMMDNMIRFYQLPGYDLDTKQLSVGGQRDLFIKERSAAMWLPVSTMHTETELAGMNWNIAKFPSLSQLPGVEPQVYPVYLFISVNSKVRDQAFEVLSFLSSEPFHMQKSREGSFVSLLQSDAVRKAFGQDAPMYTGKNVAAMIPVRTAAPSPQSKYYADASSILNTGVFAQVATGKKDVNTALREAEENLIKKIEADGK
ncbi:extracellular solute-binding protein [Paenibacillus oceani]|uniref:Extracellular solute-binding protein n=1 Tax=Paenibacillus oceani TaxID=2772510 RepID=A0A927CGU6_9BACL|nr:extracellular solute-binding protein [Paenibacillus oceani]MBD2866393.1 extracellular solute-binding protein [Paenibacillus oceani]